MLAAVLVAVVSAYLAYDPYRTEEDEVFELNLAALSGDTYQCSISGGPNVYQMYLDCGTLPAIPGCA